MGRKSRTASRLDILPLTGPGDKRNIAQIYLSLKPGAGRLWGESRCLRWHGAPTGPRRRKAPSREHKLVSFEPSPALFLRPGVRPADFMTIDRGWPLAEKLRPSFRFTVTGDERLGGRYVMVVRYGREEREATLRHASPPGTLTLTKYEFSYADSRFGVEAPDSRLDPARP